MTQDGMLRITPDMGEDDILQACAEAVLDGSPPFVLDQLERAAKESGFTSTLDLVKASMKEERDQHDSLDDWLATLPGVV